ncbi:MAG: malto-oligosyltrehalose trehalohydrolase, partial [Thermoanaerobaculia bacterium]
MSHPERTRRYPVGAEVTKDGAAFRVWAEKRKRVDVVIDGKNHPLDAERDGYFSALVPGVTAGARYGFRLDGGSKVYPDPASRRQPDGPHGLSAVVDPSAFTWSDRDWQGPDRESTVLYEMHVGTFTEEGTWAAAEEHFGHLRDVGVTAIELMPVCDFPGRFGWGYDGVGLWAPTRLYGSPDALRHFVDAAHREGLAVILDVVYNHIGPDGNYFKEFSDEYFTDRYENEWGEAINFDGEGAGPVRDFFSSNAAYWIDEFHFDGLRLDATQSIHDSSDEPILAVISRRVRDAANGRKTLLVAENEPQDIRLVTPAAQGGFGLDAMWNDDFHHSTRVALTGHTGAYYTDYRGSAQEQVSMAKHGFLYQGQWYAWQKKPRGTRSIGWPPRTFVTYIQNHDQIANYAAGDRIQHWADAGSIRAATALLLLGPGIPMLFQGQEFASSRPFTYFADHEPKLAALVEKGRKEFLRQFPAMATDEMSAILPVPHDPEVFE